jgi:DnaJ-domain-containing protein 1
MTDYFALLDEPRRPWVDPGALKNKFLQLSTELHPDRVHQADTAARQEAQMRYAELNAASSCLREPKDCVRHFLELETGSKLKDVQEIPPEIIESFLSITQACREADVFLARKAAVTSPLLQVQLFQEGQRISHQLLQLKATVNDWRNQLVEELQNLSSKWEMADGDTAREQLLKRLEEIYRLLGYYGRWEQQLHERNFQLIV